MNLKKPKDVSQRKDHVYILINCTPQHYIPEIVQKMKGITSRVLMKENGEVLSKKLWGGHLWNPSYFVATHIEQEASKSLAWLQFTKGIILMKMKLRFKRVSIADENLQNNVKESVPKVSSETRTANVIIGKSGGNAGPDSWSCKISLPTRWVRDMEITPENKEVQMKYDNGSITISPKIIEVQNTDEGYKILSGRQRAKANLQLRGYTEALDIDTGETIILVKKEENEDE